MMATAMALPNKLLISTPTSSPVRGAAGHKRTRKSPDDGSPVKRRRQSGGGGVVGPISTPLFNGNIREDMFRHYQPWVIQTYGDSAKTKTITLRKYARILRTLRGEETNSVENSKFRFWVKAKGFRVGRPAGYVPKPADAIVGSQTLGGSAHEDPPLYVPTATSKEFDKQMFKKVAVVENFFDIIFSVHVDMEGRAGKHAGQKRTYRAITETYAFLPREAVTRFLLGCTDCQRRPRSPSPAAPAPAASPAPAAPAATPPAEPPFSLPPSLRASATRRSGPPDPPEIDFSLPITTTYLKHMRSLGYSDEDALKIDVDVSTRKSLL